MFGEQQRPTSRHQAVPCGGPDSGGPTPSTWLALGKLPGIVFQLHRSVEGRWSIPNANADMQGIFSTGAKDLCPVAQLVHEDDFERVIQQLDQSREFWLTCKIRFRTHPFAGRETWIEAIAAPETALDGGTLWHGFFSDVTSDQHVDLELRRLHERWMLAAQAADMGVVEFDLQTRTLTLDAIACVHHRLDPCEPWLHLDQWLECIVPADRPVAKTTLAKQI